MPSYFSFYNDDGERTFYKKLTTQRCSGETRTGARCKRRCTIGFEFCPPHLAARFHVRIGISTIPGAGKGLFAYNPGAPANSIVFRKDQVIIPYHGERIDIDQKDERYGHHTAPYAFQVSNNDFVDSAAERGVGSLANTRNGNQNGTITQAPSLRATKVIRQGEEIFVSYGRTYRMNDGRYHTKPYPTKT